MAPTRSMRAFASASFVLVAACTYDASTDMQSSSGTPCGTSDAPIVFAAALDGQAATDLYMLNGHARPTRLTSTPGAEQRPAWSPDRKQIAFVRDGHLYVLDVATRAERRVAEHVGRTRAIASAAWSPDGTRLVYPYPRDAFNVDLGEDGILDESYDTTLHFVNADGTNDVAYTEPDDGPSQPPGIGTLAEPAWSSTDQIAFTVSDDCPDCAGGSRYVYSNPDGSDYHTIEPTDLGQYPLYPRHDLDWSPDASRWVFTAKAILPGEPTDVSDAQEDHVATRSVDDPSDILALTKPGARFPRYAPDGKSIAFLRDDGLYVMHANGTGQHRVVNADSVQSLDW